MLLIYTFTLFISGLRFILALAQNWHKAIHATAEGAAVEVSSGNTKAGGATSFQRSLWACDKPRGGGSQDMLLKSILLELKHSFSSLIDCSDWKGYSLFAKAWVAKENLSIILFFPPYTTWFFHGSQSNPVYIYTTLKALLDLQAVWTEEQAYGKQAHWYQRMNPWTSSEISVHTEPHAWAQANHCWNQSDEIFSQSATSTPEGLLQL